MASNFSNRADDLALIQWETCSAEIPQIIDESEDLSRPQVENSNNHHEDSSSFNGKFYRDIKTYELCQ